MKSRTRGIMTIPLEQTHQGMSPEGKEIRGPIRMAMGITLDLTSIEEMFTSSVNTTTIAVTPPTIF